MRPLTRPGLLVAIAVAVVALPTVASGAFSSPTAGGDHGEQHVVSGLVGRESRRAGHHDAHGLEHRRGSHLRSGSTIPNRATADAGHAARCSSSTATPTRRPAIPSRSARTTSSRSSAVRQRSSAGTGRDFTRRAGDPPATSLIFGYQGGVTITISAAELGNTKKFGFAVIAISGVAIDPTTGDIDFTNAVADVAPASGAGLYQYEVKITPPTLVVKSLKPTPKNPTGRAHVHAPARRGALRHGRGRPERQGDVRRAHRERAAQGAGSARAGRGGDLHVEHPADREGQDVPRIRRGRVRGPESLSGVLGEGSLSTAACATPSAPRLSPRCRRHHRDGLRVGRSHAARRHRAGAAEGASGARRLRCSRRTRGTACASSSRSTTRRSPRRRSRGGSPASAPTPSST